MATVNEEKKFYQSTKVESIIFKMEIDLGSLVTIVSDLELERLQIIRHWIYESNTCFRTYTGQIFKPIDTAYVNVELNGHIL